MNIRMIVVASLCALLAAGGAAFLAAADDCTDWNTGEFFEAATPETVEACLNAGEDLNARAYYDRLNY